MRNPADEWTDEEFEKLRKRLEDNYREASEGVMAQLESMLADYDRHNVEWQARVASGAVSESEYRDWLGRRATDQSIVRYTAESLANDAVNADRKAMDLINNAIPAVYAENANMAAFAIDSALGQDHSFDLYDEDTVRRLMLMDEHDQLIHEFIPVGPPVESLQTLRVDLDAVKDVNWNRQKFTSSITQSVLQGESIPDAAKRLSRVLDMDMNMATRAARTAITGAENAGRVDSYRRAVEMGLKIEQEWMATLDKRTRHSHRAVDGTHVPVGEKFIVGNTELEYPADPKGDPSETYNCRCTLVAWFPDSDQHDSERWSDLPDGMTYDEWKSGKAKDARSVEQIFNSMPDSFKVSAEDKARAAIASVVDAKGFDSEYSKVVTTLDDSVKRLEAQGYSVDVKYLNLENSENIGGRGIGIHPPFSEGGTVRVYLPDMTAVSEEVRGRAASVTAHELAHLRDVAMSDYASARKFLSDDVLRDACTRIGIEDVPQHVWDYLSVLVERVDKLEASGEYSLPEIPLIVQGSTNGGDQIFDIYDALTRGSVADRTLRESHGALMFGHGTFYYMGDGPAQHEVWANWVSLNLYRPDIAQQLAKDNPELVKALNDMKDKVGW